MSPSRQREREPVGLLGRELEAAPDQPQRRLVAVPGRLRAGGREVGARPPRGPPPGRGARRGGPGRARRTRPPRGGAARGAGSSAGCRRPRRGSARGRRDSCPRACGRTSSAPRAVAGRSRAGPAVWASTAASKRCPSTEAACSAALSAGSSRSSRACTRLRTEPGTATSAPLLGVAQELLEEERVAGGALDAALGQGGVGSEERLGQRPRRGRVERAEVDRQERAVPGLGAPSLVERVALDRGWSSPGRRGTRRRWRRAGPDARASAGPPSARPRRPGAAAAGARPLDQPRHGRALALVAAGVVHGVVERAQLDRLRQVEQVVEEHGVRLGHEAARPGPPGRGSAASAPPAPWSRPSRPRTRARIASRPVPAPKSSTSPAWQAKPAFAAASWNSSTRRVLPIPASPRT